MEFAAHFLGKKLHYTYEVSNYVPNEKLVMGTADGAMETTYTWQTVGKNTTHMTLRNRGKAPGFTALLDPIMKLAVRFATQKNLKQLKGILEK
jgi:thioredoxin reductase